jgi:ATP-binding cassette subfamily B protein
VPSAPRRRQVPAARRRDLAIANVTCTELLAAVITLLAALVTALVYGLGGTLVMRGVFQVGTLVPFSVLVSQLYRPLYTMSNLPLEAVTALVSFDRVFQILDLEPLITERPAAYPLTQTREAPGVEVAGVWFRYPEADQVSLASLEPAALPAPERPGDAWLLRDVTFQVPAGKLTALVGPSGAGKTTIMHLVPRLYDPVRGTVRIGGHDIRDLTLESLRSMVGVVPQDAHLFHDTIRANLRYARPSATEKELTVACEAARIWELISSLPDGADIAGDRPPAVHGPRSGPDPRHRRRADGRMRNARRTARRSRGRVGADTHRSHGSPPVRLGRNCDGRRRGQRLTWGARRTSR